MSAPPVPYMERSRLYYEAQGFDNPYVWAHFDDVPFTSLGKALSDCTLALVTTAALYDRKPNDARAVASAPTAESPGRLYGNDLSWDKKATHLDDLNSFFPIDHLKRLAEQGAIGGLARRFHCAPTSYSQRSTLERDGPDILERCREDRADIALLIPL
jgi:D-proline reductase (dithiol) PrdB